MMMSGGTARSVAEHDKAIASLVDTLDSSDFEREFLLATKNIVSFDMAMISVYDKDRIIMSDNSSLPFSISSAALERYEKTTYRYSPFFQHHLLGLKGGVYSMGQLASSSVLKKPPKNMEILEFDPDEEVGYCTVGWPKRLKEIDIAVKLSKIQTAQIALYRVGASPFRPSEIKTLIEVSNSLIAIYRRFWISVNSRPPKPEHEIAVLLQEMAGSSLSRRELEVLSLVVEGLSGQEIAIRLQIAEETVKTHKKRAYQKLRVGTRGELSGALLRHLHVRLLPVAAQCA